MTDIELLKQILAELTTINSFIQLVTYAGAIFLIIYFGYWFFSRFFY